MFLKLLLFLLMQNDAAAATELAAAVDKTFCCRCVSRSNTVVAAVGACVAARVASDVAEKVWQHRIWC